MIKKAARYTAKRRNINAEKRRILSLIDTHERALDYNGILGSSNPTTNIIRNALLFLRREIERDAHRGKR